MAAPKLLQVGGEHAGVEPHAVVEEAEGDGPAGDPRAAAPVARAGVVGELAHEGVGHHTHQMAEQKHCACLRRQAESQRVLCAVCGGAVRRRTQYAESCTASRRKDCKKMLMSSPETVPGTSPRG